MRVVARALTALSLLFCCCIPERCFGSDQHLESAERRVPLPGAPGVSVGILRSYFFSRGGSGGRFGGNARGSHFLVDTELHVDGGCETVTVRYGMVELNRDCRLSQTVQDDEGEWREAYDGADVAESCTAPGWVAFRFRVSDITYPGQPIRGIFGPIEQPRAYYVVDLRPTPDDAALLHEIVAGSCEAGLTAAAALPPVPAPAPDAGPSRIEDAGAAGSPSAG